MTDTIQVKNIRCYGYTGFLQEEQILGQWFDVTLTIWVDLLTAGKLTSLPIPLIIARRSLSLNSWSPRKNLPSWNDSPRRSPMLL